MPNEVSVCCTTADELLHRLGPGSNYWLQSTEWSSNWVFRGQRDAKLSLLPAAWRSDERTSKILAPLRRAVQPYIEARRSEWIEAERRREAGEQIIGVFFPLQGRMGELALQIGTELKALSDFALLADSLGFSIPRSRVSSILAQFLRAPVSSNSPVSRILISPLAALAQHHGIPTQLLDFTRNPLYAAFFAAEHVDPSSKGELAVWAVNCAMLKYEALGDPPIGTLSVPRAKNRFLHSQDGVFLFHHLAELHFHQTGEWPRFEEFIPTGAMQQLLLPYSEVPKLLRILWSLRVSRAHLMPTLDNLSVSLRTQWTAQFPDGAVVETTNS